MRNIAVLVAFYCVGVWADTLPPPCNNEIYCYGDLLRTVQMANVFEDSKTFVDKKLLNSPEETVRRFGKLMNATNRQPSKQQILDYVNTNFANGDELDKWQPTDHNANPSFLQAIKNTTVKGFANNLINLWPMLAVKVKGEVSENLDRYSFIPVPNGFIIPGGRFREFYYWDSYWIIEGLLVSEMFDTARGMIENFLYMVQQFGFVPNGGRIYYLNRSQPPLLTAMASLYYSATKNVAWVRTNIDHLANELHFWLEKRTVVLSVNCQNLTLAHYRVPSSGPRPESYREDYATAADNEEVYVDLKSGAESGWDFSSRWFFDATGGNNGNLSQIKTSRVIPVDLNAFLCGAFRDIAHMYDAIGDRINSELWNAKFEEWKRAIEIAFWDQEDGTWYDLDSELLKRRRYFYGSNLAPLWARCYDSKHRRKYARASVQYFKKENILDHLGGIPTSLQHSGQQWDFPNAWPPLQHIAVMGLAATGQRDAINLARLLARRWVNANIEGFTKTGEMFEKYDAVNVGQYGGGGEYTVQAGFGWSNGVALKFIQEFYTSL